MELAGIVTSVLNILINCNLSYYDKGHLVNQRKKIFKNLLTRSLILDMICIYVFLTPNLEVKLLILFKVLSL